MDQIGLFDDDDDDDDQGPNLFGPSAWDNRTVGTARAWLDERVAGGANCPCCQQRAQIYRRQIHSGIARTLVLFYRACGLEPGHKATVLPPSRGRDEAILRYWDLIRELDVKRDDGGRAGWWQVTDRGRAWIHGEIRVEQFVHLYDGQLLRTEWGEPRSIHDALGHRFNLAELMGWDT